MRVKRGRSRTAGRAAGATYLVLVRPDYIPGTLATASGQQLEANTGLWLTKLHDIINKARAAIDSEDVKVSELNTVPEMAYASLGIAPTSPLRMATPARRDRELIAAQGVEGLRRPAPPPRPGDARPARESGSCSRSRSTSSRYEVAAMTQQGSGLARVGRRRLWELA